MRNPIHSFCFVFQYHAKFSFSGENENGNYVLVDLGSKNGTYLNGQRLSVALSESDPFPVEHGSEIQIGSTKLLCHVHNGQETCPNCEPGIMITEGENYSIKFFVCQIFLMITPIDLSKISRMTSNSA